MKSGNIILLLLFPVMLFAQEYEIKALQMPMQQIAFSSKIMYAEYSGVVEKTDSLVMLHLPDASNNLVTATFTITNEVNGFTYLTDGTIDYKCTIVAYPEEFATYRMEGNKFKKNKKPAVITHQVNIEGLNNEPVKYFFYVKQMQE